MIHVLSEVIMLFCLIIPQDLTLYALKLIEKHTCETMEFVGTRMRRYPKSDFGHL